MTAVTPLGTFSQVGVTEAWPYEDEHFTPWLVQPENIKLLGKALDMELEVEAVEHWVGSFRADILARAVDEADHRVIIENQYGRPQNLMAPSKCRRNAALTVFVTPCSALGDQLVFDIAQSGQILKRLGPLTWRHSFFAARIPANASKPGPPRRCRLMKRTPTRPSPASHAGRYTS